MIRVFKAKFRSHKGLHAVHGSAGASDPALAKDGPDYRLKLHVLKLVCAECIVP